MLPFDHFKHNKYDSTLPTEIPNGLRKSRVLLRGTGRWAGVDGTLAPQEKLEATRTRNA